METIETDRLILRAWTDDDINEYIRVFTKPEVLHFPFGRGFTEEEAQLRVERHISAHSRGEVDQWAAVVKATQTVIGWIGLSYALDYPGFEHLMQVGWRLEPDAWGRGTRPRVARRACSTRSRTFPSTTCMCSRNPRTRRQSRWGSVWARPM
jgi:RimJ/RimL family protein N-acetyltransferase